MKGMVVLVKRIDLENHFCDQILFDKMVERTTPPFYRKETGMTTLTEHIIIPQGKAKPYLLDMGEGRLKVMDDLGIDTAVLSCYRGVELLDVTESIEVSTKTNDTLYEATQKYPGRFLGSAVLPVNDAAAACAELERCVKELGFIAWHTFSNYGSTAPEDIRYRPIFKKAAELGVYVYLHPYLDHNPRVQEYGISLAGAALGFTVDTMITITKMIMSGLFDELPNLTVILGHLGEALPFLLSRMDDRSIHHKNPNLKNKYNPSYYFNNNILVTTSGNLSKEAFYCTRDVLGIDRILFATDYPHDATAEMVKFINEIPLDSEADREAVFYKNAAEKLGIGV